MPRAVRARLVVQPLGSGSSGNSTLVRGPTGDLLIDAGFSARETLRRVEAVGATAAGIAAVILTHGHSDHAKGAPVLARKLGVPIWGTGPTLRGLGNLRGAEVLCELPEEGAVEIAGRRVEALAVSHDIPGTVILRIDGRVGVATDLGKADPGVRRFLNGLEALLLEFNHDRDLLLDGDYPPWLQDRILSDEGHLSNTQAAALLSARDFEPPSRGLYLCHLSRENNRPEIAMEAAQTALAGWDIEIRLARQEEPVEPLVL